MFDDETIYEAAYRWADDSEELPWHRESLPPLLDAYLGGETRRRSIVDIGSGTGSIAVELAERGHDVVGVEFVEQAVEMSRRRASRREVDVEFVHADVLDWEPTRSFDLAVDCGMMHGLELADVEPYTRKLASWLEAGGDLFLSHFVKRHALDWWPFCPVRRRREAVVDLVPGTFELETYAYETVPTVFEKGLTARFGHFWFRQTPERRGAELGD